MTGTASFASEQLDLTIDPESKGLRIITLRSAVRARDLSIAECRVKAGPLIARGAVAAALATLVTPAAAAGAGIACGRGCQSVPGDFIADEKVNEWKKVPGDGAPGSKDYSD